MEPNVYSSDFSGRTRRSGAFSSARWSEGKIHRKKAENDDGQHVVLLLCKLKTSRRLPSFETQKQKPLSCTGHLEFVSFFFTGNDQKLEHFFLDGKRLGRSSLGRFLALVAMQVIATELVNSVQTLLFPDRKLMTNQCC